MNCPESYEEPQDRVDRLLETSRVLRERLIGLRDAARSALEEMKPAPEDDTREFWTLQPASAAVLEAEIRKAWPVIYRTRAATKGD